MRKIVTDKRLAWFHISALIKIVVGSSFVEVDSTVSWKPLSGQKVIRFSFISWPVTCWSRTSTKQRNQMANEASDSLEKPESIKIEAWLSYLGPEALPIFNAFTFTKCEAITKADSLEEVVKKFEADRCFCYKALFQPASKKRKKKQTKEVMVEGRLRTSAPNWTNSITWKCTPRQGVKLFGECYPQFFLGIHK